MGLPLWGGWIQEVRIRVSLLAPARELLRDVLHQELPPFSEVRVEAADLADLASTSHRTTLVVLRPRLGERRKRNAPPAPRRHHGGLVARPPKDPQVCGVFPATP